MQSNLSDIPSFVPPFWGLNPHIQTIASSLFTHPQKPSCQTLNIATPDSDFLELDVKQGNPNRPVIILIHGLEGSSNSRYIIEMMRAFNNKQNSIVALNLRGCSSRRNNRRRFYHSGETDDLRTVLTWTNKHLQHTGIGAAGFSLGGNLLLKLLGEEGNNSLIDAAAAVSCPYDLYYGSQTIQQGLNRLYEWMFVRSMNTKLRDKRTVYPDMPIFTGKSLHDFDDQVTAPLNGFQSANDYYAKCSSGQFIERIQTRTLLLHSQDDPICPYPMVPLSQIKENKWLDYIMTNHGGHVGFWSTPYGWLNRTIVNYFGKIFD